MWGQHFVNWVCMCGQIDGLLVPGKMVDERKLQRKNPVFLNQGCSFHNKNVFTKIMTFL